MRPPLPRLPVPLWAPPFDLSSRSEPKMCVPRCPHVAALPCWPPVWSLARRFDPRYSTPHSRAAHKPSHAHLFHPARHSWRLAWKERRFLNMIVLTRCHCGCARRVTPDTCPVGRPRGRRRAAHASCSRQHPCACVWLAARPRAHRPSHALLARGAHARAVCACVCVSSCCTAPSPRSVVAGRGGRRNPRRASAQRRAGPACGRPPCLLFGASHPPPLPAYLANLLLPPSCARAQSRAWDLTARVHPMNLCHHR